MWKQSFRNVCAIKASASNQTHSKLAQATKLIPPSPQATKHIPPSPAHEHFTQPLTRPLIQPLTQPLILPLTLPLTLPLALPLILGALSPFSAFSPSLPLHLLCHCSISPSLPLHPLTSPPSISEYYHCDEHSLSSATCAATCFRVLPEALWRRQSASECVCVCVCVCARANVRSGGEEP